MSPAAPYFATGTPALPRYAPRSVTIRGGSQPHPRVGRGHLCFEQIRAHMDSLVLFHSYQSSIRSLGRGSRIPPRPRVQRVLGPQVGSCWLTFCFFPDFWSQLKLPRIFSTIFGDFLTILGGFLEVWGRFGEGWGLFFRCFFENANFVKIVLPCRRNAYFQGSRLKTTTKN